MYIFMFSVMLEPQISLNETTISMFTDDEATDHEEATDESSFDDDFRYILA